MPLAPSGRRPRRIIGRTVAFGTSALLAAALLSWSPAATTGWNQGSAEATLWQLMNGARTNNGLAPLQQHGILVSLARWRSSDMLAKDYFSHTIAGCGCLVYASYDSSGLRYDWAGENIGWNSGLEDSYSPVRVHEKFMASPGHRVNVMDGRFTHGGVGAAAADDRMFQGHVQNTRMYAELFMQAPSAAAPVPPPPSGGGSGGGGGGSAPPAAPQPAQPAQPARAAQPAPTPRPAPRPAEVHVDPPQRPASATGLDGVTAVVVEGASVQLAPRLAADDAIGTVRASPGLAAGVEPAAARGMQVAAPEPARAGPFDGVVGAVLGFFFG